jgi:hypothetical protein
VLAFLAHEWVVSRSPHLLFIELAINDGDTLLETGDAPAIGCALEGIVRQVRHGAPLCEVRRASPATLFLAAPVPHASLAVRLQCRIGPAQHLPATHARLAVRGVPSPLRTSV